jgi:hypothetical protein
VSLRGGRLEFSEDHSKRVVPEPGFLERFVELAEARDERILSFARRWGVLRLCKHDLPAYHPEGAWFGTGLIRSKTRWARSPFASGRTWQPQTQCHWRGETEGKGWEPVDAWRMWARRSRAMLALATELHRGRPGDREDWLKASGADEYPGSDLHIDQRPEQRWNTFVSILQEWLWLPKVLPWIDRRDGRLIITLNSWSGLFGAVVLQLVFAASRSDGLSICSGCKNAYTPTQRPARDRRRYCDTCREKGTPGKDAQADRRLRLRILSMHETGASRPAISRSLGIELSIVEDAVARQKGRKIAKRGRSTGSLRK